MEEQQTVSQVDTNSEESVLDQILVPISEETLTSEGSQNENAEESNSCTITQEQYESLVLKLNSIDENLQYGCTMFSYFFATYLLVLAVKVIFKVFDQWLFGGI